MSESQIKVIGNLDQSVLGRRYEQRVSELSLIRRLSNAITLDLGVEESAGNFLDILLDELDITNASIMLYDEEADRLRLRSVKGVYDSEARYIKASAIERGEARGASPKPGEGIAGIVYRDSQPIFVEDVERDDRFCRFSEQSVRVGSLMCLPLIIRGRTIGVINLSHVKRNAIKAEECHGVVIAANQIAMMLDSVVNYQQLKTINKALEAKVTERTAHLVETNIELQKTRSSLIRAERLKALGQMASGVAHDFNNILTGILGKTQVLLRRPIEGESREMLQSVELAAQDGAAIVRRIQDFSRKEGAQEYKVLDLNQVVRDTVNLTDTLVARRKETQSKSLNLQTHLQGVALIEGDAPELREVLTNLILNAIDASLDGGSIDIRTETDGSQMVLTVCDTGVGIAEIELESVFEPFYTTKGPTHSGLGLSVIFGIIKNHGGSISVQSEVGVGTTFTIRLPMSNKPLPEEPETVEQALSTGASILVIDDEPSVLESIVMMLEELGHEVSSAKCGSEGLASLDANAFDIVFTDLGMPDLSGWDVASEVKKRNPKMPVVLTTGWAREIDIDEARERGADFVLGKPFALDKLDEILHVVVP